MQNVHKNRKKFQVIWIYFLFRTSVQHNPKRTHPQRMGNFASLANSSVSSMFPVTTKKNRIRFKSKNKWKNINFITIEENYHFKLNNQTTTEITEHGNEPNTPMDLPRYNNNMSNIVQRLEFEEDTPVVLTASTLLQRHDYKEYLPLGLVLHVLFQNDNWLYVRTAHGHEGYVCRNKCLPLDNSYCSPRTSNYHTNTLEMFKLIV